MSDPIEIRVPDIGDFTDVPIIEIHVAPGDQVAVEDPLVTLESDKATMDVPSPAAGTIAQLAVAIGDRVSEGSLLALIEPTDDAAVPGSAATTPGSATGGAAATSGGATGGAAATSGGASGSATAATPESAAATPRGATATPGGAAATPGSATGSATAATSAAPHSLHSPGEAGRAAPSRGAGTTTVPPAPPPAGQYDAQVVVIGSGPGGYTAAFRAADLGLKTILVERHQTLGGVCLNVGCIPSKALLHAARVIAEAEEMAEHGISFNQPRIDLARLMDWKQSVVGQLTSGLAGLARQRKVEVVRGEGRFTGPHTLAVGERTISFATAIIAVGSRSARLPFLPEDERIVDSTGALSPALIPKRLLVIGGGIIGLEMAAVYDALGARVTVVELLEQLIPGCDADLVRLLHKRIEPRYEAIRLATSVVSARSQRGGVKVELSDGSTSSYDMVLVAVGRQPNGALIGADAAGVHVQENGFIPVDGQMRTNVPHIYAIGDVVGGPMLAHKATHEGKVAAEVIAGLPGAAFDPRAIPSVAYTDPEVAWAGLTETEARASDVEYEKASFPWAASGRALSLARAEGMTKLLVEPKTRRLMGAGIVGVGAGELIAEAVHALEMGSDAEDLGLTIHPHPTLSETLGFAAELATGTITDLPAPRRSRR